MRLKLSIAYDGSAYKGWQSQPFRLTVQDFLEDALLRITGSRVVVHGAGRTDTGVHALGQGAHIEVPPLFSAGEWQRMLNFNLPPTIRIMRCQVAPKTFHASRSSKGKIYRYLIRNDEVVPPNEAGRVWMVPEKLDMTLLREAATVFVGTHDFRGFTMNRKAPAQTIRHISKIMVTKKGTLISITFHGVGFLYRMVRMLTGAVVRVAQGLDELKTLERRLQHPDGAPEWQHVAPARGLCLVKVRY
ncbi:MAG: tRNA pseudouridine(38-40) synthase TruA [Terrimicrobiaceae bacterium]